MAGDVIRWCSGTYLRFMLGKTAFKVNVQQKTA